MPTRSGGSPAAEAAAPPAAPSQDAPPRYARVAVEVGPAHLDHPFDYRVPAGCHVAVGARVQVRFSGRRRLGWVLDVTAATTVAGRVLELEPWDGPWFAAADLPLYRWVAGRYGGTLASVLRHVVSPRVAGELRAADRRPVPRPPTCADAPPCPTTAWRPYDASALLRAAFDPAAAEVPYAAWLEPLPGDDRGALVADLVARSLAGGHAALVLAVDPADPALAAALAVAGAAGADLRSGVGGGRRRYRDHLRCLRGEARVAVGGPGAVLAPLAHVGLVLVLDEAAAVHKTRAAPYHRTGPVALTRARLAGATAVCVGSLPSAWLWGLVAAGHVEHVAADRLTVRARRPRVDVVDLASPRPGARRARFSSAASRALGGVVGVRRVGAVLAARRGDGTALACKGCGRRHSCAVCDGGLTGTDEGAWTCATCGERTAPYACPACGVEATAPLHAGVRRFASELARSLPAAEVVAMEGWDAAGPTGRPAVAVMTRGSARDAPGWLRGERLAVVVVPDADALLGRPGVDASEDALRLWLDAGRLAEHVVVQTREPEHHAVTALLRWDPAGFWADEVERRRTLGWPPHATLVRITAAEETLDAVALAVRDALDPLGGVEVLGPDLDGDLLVKTGDLRGTLAALALLRRGWSAEDAGVRVDVDPEL